MKCRVWGKPIRILVTGGTIDKSYNQITGELVFTGSHVREILELVRCRVEVRVETVMLKDSLEMIEKDRELILAACRQSQEQRIIITHGTDTMAQTARTLGPRLSEKTVVLLGAMVPFAFGRSDALFNLGCAFAAVQALEHGVYVTMNGRIFPWDNVRKNRELGVFEDMS